MTPIHFPRIRRLTAAVAAVAAARPLRPPLVPVVLAAVLAGPLVTPPAWAGMAAQALAATAGTATGASTPTDAAFALFLRAADGDAQAVEPAAEALAALHHAQPTDLVLLAYAGSAHAMQAGQTWLPWKKMRYAEDGLAQLDKALNQLTPAHDAPDFRGVPAVLDIKLAAANTFLALPGFFNRAERGNKLLSEVLKSPLFASAPTPFRGAAWMSAARQAQKSGRPEDARPWLQQIVTAGAPQAALAQAQLQALAPAR